MIDWLAVLTTIGAVARAGADVLGAGLGAALVLYASVPPFRRFVDGRIALYFEKQIVELKHELSLEAARVQAQHQRLLQNSAIVVERKHEVYRRLFQRLHLAMGKVTHLFGYVAGGLPDYDAFDTADVEHAMAAARVPGKTKEAIRQQWENDPKWSRKKLQQFARAAAVEDAARSFARAWNYFLGNELYLPDSIAQKAHQAFQPLEKTLNLAKNPGSRGDYSAWGREASDRVTELKDLLRAELRVVDEEPSKSVART